MQLFAGHSCHFRPSISRKGQRGSPLSDPVALLRITPENVTHGSPTQEAASAARCRAHESRRVLKPSLRTVFAYFGFITARGPPCKDAERTGAASQQPQHFVADQHSAGGSFRTLVQLLLPPCLPAKCHRFTTLCLTRRPRADLDLLNRLCTYPARLYTIWPVPVTLKRDLYELQLVVGGQRRVWDDDIGKHDTMPASSRHALVHRNWKVGAADWTAAG